MNITARILPLCTREHSPSWKLLEQSAQRAVLTPRRTKVPSANCLCLCMCGRNVFGSCIQKLTSAECDHEYVIRRAQLCLFVRTAQHNCVYEYNNVLHSLQQIASTHKTHHIRPFQPTGIPTNPIPASKMRFDVQSTFSLAILSIVNMCLCIQDLAEKTLNSLGTELMQAARHQPLVIAGTDQHRHQLDGFKMPGSAENFMLVDQLADGERERRINFNGLTAKETTIGNDT